MGIKNHVDEPYDRGDSDARYGRKQIPHKRFYIDGKYHNSYVLTFEERQEYYAGYEENPSGRKDRDE
jgi:hypothetical protein